MIKPSFADVAAKEQDQRSFFLSLDGFTTGPNGELEWAIVDEELNPYVDGLFRNVDTALYGRVTYLGMQSYWPTALTDPEASPRDLAHARWVENVSKSCFQKRSLVRNGRIHGW